jgi:hypothetical protein
MSPFARATTRQLPRTAFRARRRASRSYWVVVTARAVAAPRDRWDSEPPPTRVSSLDSIPFQYEIRGDKCQGDDRNHCQRRVTMPALFAIGEPRQFDQAQVLEHGSAVIFDEGLRRQDQNAMAALRLA